MKEMADHPPGRGRITMKKTWIALLLSLFLFGCRAGVTTTSLPGVPAGLSVTDDTLSWIPVEGAFTYEVRQGDTTVVTPGAAYDLSAFAINDTYAFQVRTVFPDDTRSAYSAEILWHHYEVLAGISDTIDNTPAVAYETGFAAGGLVLRGVLDEDGIPLSDDLYAFAGGVLTIAAAHVGTLAVGTHVLTILTSAGAAELSLTVVDDEKPYMISSSQVVFTGADVSLDFNVYDGTIVSLSGNDIEPSDYAIDGSSVTIAAAYIEGKFTDEPERTVLILGYQLQAGDHTTIGYVFIRMPS